MDKDEQIKVLREVVEQCKSQFAYYEKEHLKKFTEEGNRKAEVNKGYVELCGQVLHDTHPDFTYSLWGRVAWVAFWGGLLALGVAMTGFF